MPSPIARHLTRGFGGIALLCLGGADLIAAEPGNVTVAAQTADSVTLASGADRVLVRVLKPNLLQVDYRPGDQTSPNTLILDPAFAGKTWTPGTVTIADGAGEVVLTTSAMVVKIAKSPCRISVYQTDGATRIFGEPSAGGMSDRRVKLEFDNGLNWYGIQSAPSERGRDIDGSPESDYVAQTFVNRLIRQGVSPAVDLNGRFQGSASGTFAWTTGASGKPGFGLLWDNDGGSVAFGANTLEMNKTNERCSSSVSSTKLNTLWFAMVGTPSEITRSMIEVSGKPQMFPKFAQGLGNTEWGINEAELRTHINTYRSRRIPLDYFQLDFDWKKWDLNDHGNFEWNTALTADAVAKSVPGFPSASDTTLKTHTDGMGVKLMGITKPRIHVKTVHGNVVTAGSTAGATWRNATSVGWWLPTGDPNNFLADYWGYQRGRTTDTVGNLNFFIPAAREWYAKNTIDRAFDKGIIGYWNDEGDEGSDPGDIPTASNFYNTLYQEGIYTYQRANKPGTRVWSLNRHAYLGAQRYGYGIWTGDTGLDWRVLKIEAPRMLQTINAGMARVGTDAPAVGGNASALGPIGSDEVARAVPSGELYARWVQFAAMQPTFRLHGTYLTNRQPWIFGAEAEAAATDVVRLRSKLIPYIYAHDRIYNETGIPFVQPLIWDNPNDANVADRSDAWMFGRHLLAAPIVQPRATVTSPDGSQSMAGTTTKAIYLPAGTWYDYFRGTVHAGGASFDYPISTATLCDLPLYVRKGAIIPSLPVAPQYVGEKPVTTVRVDLFPDTAKTTFPYYDDDGVSYAYENGSYFKQDLSVQQAGTTVTVTLGDKQGSYTPALTHYLLAINKFSTASIAGFTKYDSQAALEAAAGEGWAMGASVHGSVVLIRVAAGSARNIAVTGSTPTIGIVTQTLPVATRNAPYDAQLCADGLGATSTWAVNPALPAGLTLNPLTGRITGTPTEAVSGSYAFQVSSSGSVSKPLTLTVTAAPFLAHEAFRYTSGAIDGNGVGGENGFAEPWQRLVGGNGQGSLPVYPANYVAGLTTPGITGTGGAVEFGSVLQVPGNQNSNKAPDYARKLLTGFTDAVGANAWVGFIGRGSGSGNTWLGVGLYQDNSEKLVIGQPGGTTWGLAVTASPSAQTNTSVGNTAFIVANIRVRDAGTREVRLWVNPTPGAAAPTDASAATMYTTGTNLSFNTLRLRGDSGNTLTVDELRVGGTFAEVCGITSTLPELDVSRAGAAVGDGSTDVIVGSAAATPQSLSYLFTNSGDGTITLSGGVSIQDRNNCEVTITAPPASSVASGASTTLVVSVTPAAAGPWSFRLSAANNDSDENPYDWTVSGIAAALPAPELDITRNGLAVADGGTDGVQGSAAGAAQTLSYLLTNSGSGPLTIDGTIAVSASSNCVVAIVTPPAASIATGASGTLVVSVTPTAAGAWSFRLSAGNNDPDENPYDWTVSGTAAAEAVAELDVARGATAIGVGANDAQPASTAGAALAVSYALVNSGSATLTVTTPVALSAPANCAAVVTAQPAGSIAAGVSGSLVLSVTPTAAGPWSVAVAVANSDGDENPYAWTVSGTAAAAPPSDGAGGAGGGVGDPGGKRGCGLGSGFTAVLMLGASFVVGRWRRQPSEK